MKKAAYSLVFLGAVAALIASCAKIQSTRTYEADKRFLDAWLQVNHPEAKDISGVVILEDEPGTGDPVADSAWIFVEYTAYDLNGQIQATTTDSLNKRLGEYDESHYYGPVAWSTAESSLSVGMERAIKGSRIIEGAAYPEMRVGGYRKFLVPIWLGGTSRYETEEEYLENTTSSSNYIYEMRITDCTNDISKWQMNLMKEYSAEHLEGMDTTSNGFYYKQLKAPVEDKQISDDSTIYVNYIGRLLSGKVFDTNIKDTAKMYHIYNASSSYKPVEVNYHSDATKVTMSSNSVITGFGMAISKMKRYEKCFAMFFSDYGYGSAGSGNTIPSYAPLIFEIEMVDKID